MTKNSSRLKISIVLNTIIIIFTIIASLMMFLGIKISTGPEPVLEVNSLSMFKFFTVDSNFAMCLVAFIFLIYELKMLKGKIKEIPKIMYILKLMTTTAVTLTFLVVFLYLGPVKMHGIMPMIRNSNFFFHLLIPITSLITFCGFEKTNKLEFKDTIYGIIPTLIYSIYYLTNILIHMSNGKVSTKYDWYWFAQKGVISIIIILPIFLLFTYIISIIIYKLNKE